MCVPANSGLLCLSSCVCLYTVVSSVCHYVYACKLWSALSSRLCLQTVVSSACHRVCACMQWSALSVIMCVPANRGQLCHHVCACIQWSALSSCVCLYTVVSSVIMCVPANRGEHNNKDLSHLRQLSAGMRVSTSYIHSTRGPSSENSSQFYKHVHLPPPIPKAFLTQRTKQLHMFARK